MFITDPHSHASDPPSDPLVFFSQVFKRLDRMILVEDPWETDIIEERGILVAMDWFQGKSTGLSPASRGKIYGFGFRCSLKPIH